MRIISGLLKGKTINFLRNSNTRPLKDSVKENIFNILRHSNLISVKIEKANVLDVYSGIGSFGLECISRGAKKVTFVEQDIKAEKILRKNIDKLQVTNKSEIIYNKVENFLNVSKKEKYNIFFLDPPFIDKKFVQILNLLKNKKIFKKKHIIIIHREKKTKDELNSILDTIITKKYGRSKLIFGLFN
jgi:16S rRNA (guanine966-N2)-methyltransferase